MLINKMVQLSVNIVILLKLVLPLINLLPSKVLNFATPVETLLHVNPNYESLRIFGCACWPNLRPYNQRKLAFRSKQCVFLGYSLLHKGVKCLDVSTGRIYISRDVVFDENIFPFASLHSNAGARLREEILLLPTHASSTTSHEGVHIHDNVHIIPITNPLQVVADDTTGVHQPNIQTAPSHSHSGDDYAENNAPIMSTGTQADSAHQCTSDREPEASPGQTAHTRIAINSSMADQSDSPPRSPHMHGGNSSSPAESDAREDRSTGSSASAPPSGRSSGSSMSPHSSAASESSAVSPSAPPPPPEPRTRVYKKVSVIQKFIPMALYDMAC
jgi:hypothetical protein